MSESNEWQENNERQLAAALADLRERLERLARRFEPERIQLPDKPPAASVPPDHPAASFFARLRRAEPAPEPPPAPAPALLLPPPAGRAPVEFPAALEDLAGRLPLNAFEKRVLLLCVAMELDTRMASLCARAQGDPNMPFPTFGLALALFEDEEWAALLPERPLRYWRLIEIHNPTGLLPVTASPLRADDRIVHYFKGLNFLDERVAAFISPLAPEGEPEGQAVADLSDSQVESVQAILRQWQHLASSGPLPPVQLIGPDPQSKQLAAASAASMLNRRLYHLPAETLPKSQTELDLLARLWQRESCLLPLALYLDAEEMDAAAMEKAGLLTRFLTRSDGVFFVGVRELAPRLTPRHAAVEIGRPTPPEQRAAWEQSLGAGAGEIAAKLAAHFNLNLPAIRLLAQRAQAEAGSADQLPAQAWEICCAAERPRLDALAQRLDPKATWDDIVLPAQEIALLRQIAAQVADRDKVYGEWGFGRKMNRGFGISALFAGDSGAGKTMAAEVIASALQLNLYRIDLSAVVNKYIGETEKNLRRLFDAAEDGGCILFFDEADALFGRRSEVKDSHDRYANIEINYLLQRLESYRGLAILATNMKNALDPAFLRRLRFIVSFPFPGPEDRRRMWERVFLQPDAAAKLPAPPLARLDYGRLARLNLIGGQIQNVALNAAFMAASQDSAVTMPLVLEASRAEFVKLGRPVYENDFQWTEPARAKVEEYAPI